MFDASRTFVKTKPYRTSRQKLEVELAEIEKHYKKVELIIELFCQTWTSYLSELLVSGKKEEEAEELADNLVLNLILLSRHFIEPDKPTGIGSKSKRGGPFKDDLLPLVQKIEKDVAALVKQLESSDWTPDLALQAAWSADLEIRTVRSKLRSAIVVGTNKSKTEERAFRQLAQQLDESRAAEIINALIFDLERIEFDVNLTAHSWSDRIRLRLRLRQKKGVKKPRR